MNNVAEIFCPMSEANRTKVCYQELFESFKEQAEAWLAKTPEAGTLFLLVDWNVGKNDFPPVHVVSRDNLNEETILSSMTQTLKLLDLLSKSYKQQIAQIVSAMKQSQANVDHSVSSSQ